MITLKSNREIEEMEKSGALLASVHVALRDFIKPGITTLDIDKYVHKLIEKGGGIAAQIGYEGYKFATCTSVNDEICHGLPSHRVLKSGDIVKVDMCVDLNGAISDSCWCYAVGDVSEDIKKLMEVTKQAMYLGIEQAKVGNRIGDIGHAIQTYVESHGYGVVRDFIGHGVGPTIHEGPAVPHYGEKGKGLRLKEGMTITIEPMVNTGTWQMKMDDNGWTARTKDGGLSCQYEHTLAIMKEGPKLLTQQPE
ncbi:type I methionyl aminopeptidase [Carnobacteriaceae bacterium zg-84]|uniref:type I methionyl aminopeptidase n=1 Tax=Granulicatella sp. zg-84 TaxID=2678503 RepID=UPI0013BF0300|nr:type I methionyl aminopeptidase [Granulicatella sp. zg-84]NEW66138.1 type I methionyl aminopeptidase [Granulicatella sp. zg-84]QMI86105.1 type I methionyl aminopeptidase [Carnobacteriaceae bacterium zg-84]